MIQNKALETYEQNMKDSDAVFKAMRNFESYEQAEQAIIAFYATDLSYSRGGICHALKRLEHFYKNEKISWKQNVLNANISTDVDVISETVESLFFDIESGGIESIDLSNILDSPKQNISLEHLVTVLRTTYTWKDKIHGWNECLAIARKLTIERQIDISDLLSGMLT